MDTGSSEAQSEDPCAEAYLALAEVIKRANTNRTPLNLIGGNSKAFYGREPHGEPLSTSGLSGIIEYQAAELVVTVRAGTPLVELEHALANEQQMLSFEPPHFGTASTIGGVIGAGLAGPRRPFGGAVRDSMLGVRTISHEGETLEFGGQVMKNVAGYDVSRLMVGAMGGLGLMTAVSLRVAPLPACERTFRWQFSLDAALQKMIGMAQGPWPLSALAFADGVLSARLSGHADGVADAQRQLAPETVEDNDFWPLLRDQSLDFFGGGAPLWRLSVPPAADMPALDGRWLIEWGGALRWLTETSSSQADICAAAAAMGGHASLFRHGSREEPFTHLDPVNFKLHQRLKQSFDPHGIFNPGRLYREL